MRFETDCSPKKVPARGIPLTGTLEVSGHPGTEPLSSNDRPATWAVYEKCMRAPIVQKKRTIPRKQKGLDVRSIFPR